MSRPAAVLVALSVIAIIGGVFLQRIHTGNRATGPRPADSGAGAGTISVDDAPDPAVVENIRAYRLDVARLEAMVRDAETRNTILRSDLSEALQGRIPSAGKSAPQGPAGQPGETPPQPDPSTMTAAQAVSAQAELQARKNELYSKAEELDLDSRDLAVKLDEELLKLLPPPGPEQIAAKLTEIRKLPFKTLPAWQTLSTEEIRARLKAVALAAISDQSAAVRERAMRAIGFVTPDQPPFDWSMAVADLYSAQHDGGFYDKGANIFFRQEEASLVRSDSRDRFAGALTGVLLAQNFPAADPLLWLDTKNDDAARAALSVIFGDSSATRVQYSLDDQLAANFDRGGAPTSLPPSNSGPAGLTQLWNIQANAGTEFYQTLRRRGGTEMADKAYARLPRSMSEVLHPDSLYLADPPFVPVDVSFSDPLLHGVVPFFTNVAGEYGIFLIMRTLTDEDYSLRISEGWHGDRYYVYDSPEGPGREHVIWKSVWTDDRHAEEFFQGMRRWIMSRYRIPWRASLDRAPDFFAVDEPRRTIRLRKLRDGKSVVLVDATTAAAAAELDAKSGAAP